MTIKDAIAGAIGILAFGVTTGFILLCVALAMAISGIH